MPPKGRSAAISNLSANRDMKMTTVSYENADKPIVRDRSKRLSGTFCTRHNVGATGPEPREWLSDIENEKISTIQISAGRDDAPLLVGAPAPHANK